MTLFDYEVIIAVDGREGLERAQADRDNIDLILMDMNLPEIDGWEVTRRLKADETTRSLPVIALTAHAMMGDREKALAAGCDDYATEADRLPEPCSSMIQSWTSKAPFLMTTSLGCSTRRR